MHAKSYVPGYVPPQSSPLPSPIFQPITAITGATFPAPSAGVFNGNSQQSRKRSYNDSNGGGSSGDYGYARGDRQFKQMRRGSGRGGREDGFGGRGGRGNYYPPPTSHSGPSPSLPGFPNLPLPPPPGAPFDDPMAAILAMQAMGLPLPGMPPHPLSTSSPPAPQYGQSSPNQAVKNHINSRCRDYDTRGFCTRSASCPFIHENSVVMPDQEYDPKNAVMTDVQMSPTTPRGLDLPLSDPHANGYTRGSGRGRGRGDRGGFAPGRPRNRAEFSHSGPNFDRSITTIVVEQIPEEHFDEQSVRAFFTQFGTIESVEMRPYKRLALVKYADNASANRAYNSPKVIFDNRFVKVFWYKPPPADTSASPNGKPAPTSTNAASEPDYDKEKFARDAEAAQKKLDEKKALMKDAESKRQALEKQQEELARRQAEEKRKLQEKLAAKGQGSPPAIKTEEQTNGTANGDKDVNVSAQTKALRAQVAALEAEAKSLGLDHALSEDPWTAQSRGRGRGRGRGSYRGWEGFATGRGGYTSRGRGGHRGRGGGSTGAGYALDLRPRRVAVAGVEWTGERDEGLRQYLLVSCPFMMIDRQVADLDAQGLGEYEALHPHPTNPSQLVITFKQRFEAENLFFGTRDIPDVGKVEMSWVANDPASSTPIKKEEDIKMEGMDDGQERNGNGVRGGGGGEREREVDFDVAEEDDFDVAS